MHICYSFPLINARQALQTKILAGQGGGQCRSSLYEGCRKQRSLFVFAIALLFSLAGCSQNESTTAEYIVFASNRTATGDLYIMNPDGTGVKMITTVEGFKKEPCLSYDGFIVYQTGSRSIRRIDMDGNNDVALNAYGTGAEWSPNGKYIVFQNNDWDIIRMDRDGENVINLTDSEESSDGVPTWSPDGQKILWKLQGDLWVMNVDGSGKRMIPGEGISGRSEYSPDGRRIAYTSYTGQRTCIFIMDSDGTDVHQLTMENAEGYGDYEVTWSPDGKKLLFMRTYVVSYSETGSPQEYQSDLCVLDLESGGVTKLTTGPETDMCPSWKRVQKPPDSGSPIVGY